MNKALSGVSCPDHGQLRHEARHISLAGVWVDNAFPVDRDIPSCLFSGRGADDRPFWTILDWHKNMDDTRKNTNRNASADDRSRFRAAARVSVMILFLGVTFVFSASRAMAILELYQKGLRHDAVFLLTARDVSFAIVLLSGGFLLFSLISDFGRVARFIALALLVLGICSTGISSRAEQRLRVQVHDSLQQLRRALDDYNHEKDSHAASTTQTPQGDGEDS